MHYDFLEIIMLGLGAIVTTLIAYGLFPLIFAKVRKKNITKKKYNVICYCVNFLVTILFFILNGEVSSVMPYFLWTSVFTASGNKILKKRGLLIDNQPGECNNDDLAHPENEIIGSDVSEDIIKADISTASKEKPPIRFCRKCGFELIADSDYCSKCGTLVKRGGEHEML